MGETCNARLQDDDRSHGRALPIGLLFSCHAQRCAIVIASQFPAVVAQALSPYEMQLYLMGVHCIRAQAIGFAPPAFLCYQVSLVSLSGLLPTLAKIVHCICTLCSRAALLHFFLVVAGYSLVYIDNVDSASSVYECVHMPFEQCSARRSVS